MIIITKSMNMNMIMVTMISTSMIIIPVVLIAARISSHLVVLIAARISSHLSKMTTKDLPHYWEDEIVNLLHPAR